MFRWMSEFDEKKTIFPHGHLVCSFKNSAEKLRKKSENFSLNVQKGFFKK